MGPPARPGGLGAKPCLVLQQLKRCRRRRLRHRSTATTAVQQLGEFNVAQLAEYEGLRGRFDRDKILGFLAKRPWTVAGRLGHVLGIFLDTKNAWESQESIPEDQRTRGATLNAAIAGLGPVSVKVGQTLIAATGSRRRGGLRSSEELTNEK